METGLSLLSHAFMPLKFWDETFISVVHLINRMPSVVLQNKSPYRCLFHKDPDYMGLKVFGCQVFPYLGPYKHHKLEFRSQPCTSPRFKRYKCLSSNGMIYVVRHVVFNEWFFPYSTAQRKLSTARNITKPIVVSDKVT